MYTVKKTQLTGSWETSTISALVAVEKKSGGKSSPRGMQYFGTETATNVGSSEGQLHFSLRPLEEKKKTTAPGFGLQIQYADATDVGMFFFLVSSPSDSLITRVGMYTNGSRTPTQTSAEGGG